MSLISLTPALCTLIVCVFYVHYDPKGMPLHEVQPANVQENIIYHVHAHSVLASFAVR